MQPIRDLLDRIRWDRNFGGELEIAFLDRTQPELQRIALRDMRFGESSFSFQLMDETGRFVTIPLHRIRQVYRNGELIWSRPE